jgi:hypothetical protein
MSFKVLKKWSVRVWTLLVCLRLFGLNEGMFVDARLMIFGNGGVFFKYISDCQPIPVAVRPKAWVCGSSLAGIAGSNLAGGMDVCLL